MKTETIEIVDRGRGARVPPNLEMKVGVVTSRDVKP